MGFKPMRIFFGQEGRGQFFAICVDLCGLLYGLALTIIFSDSRLYSQPCLFITLTSSLDISYDTYVKIALQIGGGGGGINFGTFFSWPFFL